MIQILPPSPHISLRLEGEEKHRETLGFVKTEKRKPNTNIPTLALKRTQSFVHPNAIMCKGFVFFKCSKHAENTTARDSPAVSKAPKHYPGQEKGSWWHRSICQPKK